MRYLKHTALGLALVAAIFFTPLAYLTLTTPIVTVKTAQPADTAIIFGAIVRDGNISPLHRERLEAGLALLQQDIAQTITVSNTQKAATIMSIWLSERGVLPQKIAVDGSAVTTSDTCRAVKGYTPGGGYILVSQRFHLPRIALQCRASGITGQYLAADNANTPERATATLWTKLRIRSYRHTREAFLVWSVLIGNDI